MSTSHEGLAAAQAEINIKTDFADILNAGHAIHLWNTGGSVRVAEILRAGEKMGHTASSKLGYGADATAAEALQRALASYRSREQAGREVMAREDFEGTDSGLITGAYPDGTYLDAVAAKNEVSFFVEEGRVVAKIPAITFGDGGFAFGRGEDMQAALDDLQKIAGGRTF